MNSWLMHAVLSVLVGKPTSGCYPKNPYIHMMSNEMLLGWLSAMIVNNSIQRPCIVLEGA